MRDPLLEHRTSHSGSTAPGFASQNSPTTGASRRQLMRVNSQLESIIAQRTARIRELVAELDEVSYTLVHDMRAPLRAIRGFAELLQDSSTNVPAADRQGHLDRIITASHRLDQLIRDALTYNRAVLRVLPLEAVDLHKLVQGLLETYPRFQSSHAAITVEGHLPVVLGNEALLNQCFSSLLDNAVKFVPAGTRPQVRLWAESSRATARVWVVDNGIGIPRHAQDRLFGLFQKLNHEYEGTGLGLAIARKAVERMDGKIGVESDADEGSRFWLEFRRAITE